MAQPVPTAGSQPAQDDWPEQVAGSIVDTVDRIRGATVGPLGIAARGIVYGFIIAVLGIALLSMLLVMTVRGVDILVGLFVDGATIWITYTLLGAVFTLLGGGLLLKARAAGRRA